ncbi:hypothetical protein AB4Y42_03775 [Paraburkholderia sp. EG286B]|uniref:hypothetical protein n=1 Tax=Paraburkholderia sp. EG286B TaxID=3237011 RepID=UPI0034D216FC
MQPQDPRAAANAAARFFVRRFCALQRFLDLRAPGSSVVRIIVDAGEIVPVCADLRHRPHSAAPFFSYDGCSGGPSPRNHPLAIGLPR